MSNLSEAWAWAQKCPPATKIVLVALADRADDEGICWPGIKGLAEKCSLSKAAIRYHIRALRKLGLVHTEERTRADGSQTSNRYILPVDILIPPYQHLDTPL